MIAQPTFLPWLGWFDLVNQSDLIVLLDTVQFSKQSWQQRNRLRTRSGLDFITVPVKTSGRFGQKIHDVEISDNKFESKFINILKILYASSPCYPFVSKDLENRLPSLLKSGKLLALNEGLIKFCLEWLKIQKKYVLASDLKVGGHRGEYLANICHYLNCDEYLSTEGAEDYLREDYNYFFQKSISIKIHRYEHPVYKQLHVPFIPYASVLDLIMMYGGESKDVLRNGKRSLQYINLI